MIETCEVKLSEISKITGHDKSIISKYFKNLPEGMVTRVNNRIVGVSPEGANDYLVNTGLAHFNRGAVILLANICGGVGKTTGTHNIAAGLRRLTSRNDPIVIIDGDPQASLTKHIFKEVPPNNTLLLIDFLEGRATIDDILIQLNNNIWFLKSNLNQSFIERVLSKPQEIKNGMLRFYQSIFDKLGNKTKIIQDHNPSLNIVLASSICAIHQLESSILTTLMVPMRGDDYAITGAQNTLRELKSLKETYSFTTSINLQCYFSSMDSRISTMASVLNKANEDKELVKHLSSVGIRFSDDVHKSINERRNVYTKNPSNKAVEDYNELVNNIFGYHT